MKRLLMTAYNLASVWQPGDSKRAQSGRESTGMEGVGKQSFSPVSPPSAVGGDGRGPGPRFENDRTRWKDSEFTNLFEPSYQPQNLFLLGFVYIRKK